MARLLDADISSSKAVTTSKSHVRLLRKGKDTTPQIDAIVPKIDSLEAATKFRRQQEEETQQLLDLVQFEDTLLDDSVRMLANDCYSYDLQNVNNPVFNKLFPDGGFSGLIKMNVFEEPNEVALLVMDLKGLGETHPLAPHVARLETAIANSRAAIANYEKGVQDVKALKKIENQHKAALIKAYSDNWHDMSKILGKKNADRYFPKVYSSSKSNGLDPENGGNESEDKIS